MVNKDKVIEYIVSNDKLLKDLIKPELYQKQDLYKQIDQVFHDDIRMEYYTKCMSIIAHIVSKETGIALDEVYYSIDTPEKLVDLIVGS